MSRTNTAKIGIATAYGNLIAKVSLHSTDPGSAGVNEITGGSPAYARVTPPTPTVNGTGQMSFQVTLNVAAGTTVAGVGLWDSSGNFLDGGAVTSQTYGSQGTATVQVTFQAN